MDVKNSIPDLCEFAASKEEASTDGLETCLKVDLRINVGEIPLGDDDCCVSFRKLTLSADVVGVEVVPGTRFGEPRKRNQVPVTKSTTVSRSRSKAATADLRASVDDDGFALESSVSSHAGKGFSDERTTKILDENNHLRVAARPNLRWEVTEPGNEHLIGTYLEDDALFHFRPVSGSNQQHVQIEIKVKQKDLLIDNLGTTQSAKRYFQGLSTNQKRLIDIFIAKSLSGDGYDGRRYLGEIILSKMELTNEG